jgi:hypothetical protein
LLRAADWKAVSLLPAGTVVTWAFGLVTMPPVGMSGWLLVLDPVAVAVAVVGLPDAAPPLDEALVDGAAELEVTAGAELEAVPLAPLVPEVEPQAATVATTTTPSPPARSSAPKPRRPAGTDLRTMPCPLVIGPARRGPPFEALL